MSKKIASKSKKNKTQRPIFKWLLIGLGVIVIWVSFNFYKNKKAADQHRAAMEEQRQVMIESWEAQGLSEEEIQEKLDSLRPTGVRDGKRRGDGNGMGIMRVIGGGKGSERH